MLSELKDVLHDTFRYRFIYIRNRKTAKEEEEEKKKDHQLETYEQRVVETAHL